MLMALTIITPAMLGYHKDAHDEKRKNPTGTHLLHLGQERRLLINALSTGICTGWTQTTDPLISYWHGNKDPLFNC